MIRVGVYGATGYMGGEALRILAEHPAVSIAWATSRSTKPLSFYHPNLIDLEIDLTRPEEISDCDAVLLALPAGEAMRLTPGLLARGMKVIDLGADFRLRNRADWERVYGRTHVCWELAEEAIYGLPELHRERIKTARVIANPGCYSSAAILGLAPLVQADLIDTERIVVDGLSGTTGAGAELSTPTHHPEIANNLIPYNVVDHRHTYEIEQELGLLTKARVAVHFTSTYVPISRGILAISHCFPKTGMKRADLLALYREFYQGEYFIKIFDRPKEEGVSWQYTPYPWVAAVSGTNFCHIGLDVDEKRGRIVVFSVLDSVGKGGAHAAVQNLNLMFGLPERTGLERRGLHPY